MRFLPIIRVFLFVLFATSASYSSANAEPMPELEQLNFFENKIRPILIKHCYECHSAKAESMDSDFSVDTRMGIRSAGSTGNKAIILGNPNASNLLKAIRHEGDLQMPPENKLPKSVIADFKKWIEMGAPDPRDGNPIKILERAKLKKQGKLWSLKKLSLPIPPEVKFKEWPRTPVDRFILASMESKNLFPVQDADNYSLIRRVYFDLIGLPPSPEQVQAFAKNPSVKEYEKIVDSLLASPQFGERWGRHWLDLARYAESSGMEFNFTYPHAWPYRDYVIRSFNNDKPYDRFVTEQLAGDLLPAKNWEERDDNRLATGFLAIGTKRHDAGSTEFTMDLLDDQIKATTEVFLGLTVGCARCHDHKFDPIPTKDYYSMASIFRSTQNLHGTKKIKYSRHPTGLIPFGKDADKREKVYRAHQSKIADLKKQLQRVEKELKERNKKTKNVKKEDRAKNEKAIVKLDSSLQSFKKKIASLEKSPPEKPLYGMGVEEGKPVDLYVAVGGNPSTKGEKAPRGFLSSVSLKDTPKIKTNFSGRLELAKWITDPDNPLTSRVMVNRIWQHLFGRGIVETTNNFGVLGRKPSHPELLDYLATTYIKQGWSTKKMIRSLVLTRTYQLSTHLDESGLSIDPKNVYLWRASPRRLQVEPIRDSMLAVSGELDLTPAKGSTITPVGQKLARDVPYEKLNPDSNHRSVYLPVVRSYPRHMMQEFDFAASTLIVGSRSSETTAKQALFMLNNELVIQQAQAAARLIINKIPKDQTAQVKLIYLRSLSRLPTEEEQETAISYLVKAKEKLNKNVADEIKREELALASFIQMIFSSTEFRYLIQPVSSERQLTSK